VIGNDPVRRDPVSLRLHPGQINAGGNQGLEQVDVVIVMDALQHRTDALQSHSGINRRFRQAGSATIGGLFKLHEHQIPDFDEAIAVLVRTARRSPRYVIAMIKEDF
jgi:hypothetical protein